MTSYGGGSTSYGGMATGTGVRPNTMMGGGGTTLGRLATQVQEGTFTSTVYTMINEKRYDEVIEILTTQLESNFPRSRAALSLLSYCHYHKGDYNAAANSYEQLVKAVPGVDDYQLYWAQSLHKAGRYPEALKACMGIEGPQYATRVSKLTAAIKLELEEYQACKQQLDKTDVEDADITIMRGCMLYREGQYEQALNMFQDAMTALGWHADLAYNCAVTLYQLKQWGPSLKYIAEIIEKGIHEHPEMSIGSNTEGLDVRSVGNSQALKETALVEAFNLKSAIEYMMKNVLAAKEALTDMPPRAEAELDPVTLHNSAIVNMADDPTQGFKKLNHLLQNPPFPPETFHNLLLFYAKYQYFDLAADVLAENAHLAVKFLSQHLYDFLDGGITAQTAPAEAYRKFDILSQKHVESLRKLTKQIKDAKDASDAEMATRTLKEYDRALEEYIPVLMAQAKIYWDIENYPMVERLHRQSIEYCSDHDTWKLNLAHTFFMQDNKFREAIKFYEPMYERAQDNVLQVSAIVLANLCVSYIMTSMNERAEEVMRRIEKEEEKLTFSDPEKQPLHLCIVNLVIGTLYCAKGNFEFGISRVMKSLEPINRKLMTDTWFYAKRCFLALANNLAKHMVTIKDATFVDILKFFDEADMYGKAIPAIIHPDPSKHDHSPKNTVRYEARLLKRMYLKLRE
eukprot:PhM_4_TR1501/c0_g1_i1/m.45887/K19683/TTC30, DYF1; tetratricopeptide repeat protein 30